MGVDLYGPAVRARHIGKQSKNHDLGIFCPRASGYGNILSKPALAGGLTNGNIGLHFKRVNSQSKWFLEYYVKAMIGQLPDH